MIRDPGAGVVIFLGIVFGVVLLGTALIALWQWRQTKVDLIALEEKVQAKRRRKPGHQVRGLSEADLTNITTWKLGDRYWVRRR